MKLARKQLKLGHTNDSRPIEFYSPWLPLSVDQHLSGTIKNAPSPFALAQMRYESGGCND